MENKTNILMPITFAAVSVLIAWLVIEIILSFGILPTQQYLIFKQNLTSTMPYLAMFSSGLYTLKILTYY